VSTPPNSRAPGTGPGDPVSGAGPLVLAVQSDHTDPPGLVGQWLAERGVSVVSVHACCGQVVPVAVPAGVSGVLPLGGAMGAWEDDVAPWLPATRDLLVDAVTRSIPVLGLCLGGQLLAAALGGLVDVAPVAEVGVVEVHRTEAASADPVFAGVPAGGLPAATWHGDAVLNLPDDAVLLMTNDACSVQAFRVGECGYGLQFHPEIDHEIVAAWVSDDGPLSRAGRTGAEVLREVADAQADLVAIWRPVAYAWADLVRLRAAGPAAGR